MIASHQSRNLIHASQQVLTSSILLPMIRRVGAQRDGDEIIFLSCGVIEAIKNLRCLMNILNLEV